MKSFCFSIGKKDDQKKLPAFLVEQKELRLSSQKKARKLLERGRCAVNGRIRTFASTLLREGDEISLVFEEEESCSKRREIPSIIYEDEDLFIVDKPSGLQSEQEAFEKFLGRPCHMVHRLDKDTSGLILVANNQKSAQKFQQLFAKREVSKKYLAIVDGAVHEAGTVQASLQMKGRIGFSVYFGVHPEGKSAKTSYEPLITKKEATLLLLTPHTGRTHQIRVHMASIGNPLLGDYQYAESFLCQLRPSRHLLHAWKVEFLHPILRKNIQCLCEVPKDFAEIALQLFGKDWKEQV